MFILEEVYGLVEEGNIIEVLWFVFQGLGDNIFIVGNYVILMDDFGDVYNGKILFWIVEKVKVDFNYEMAGCMFYFFGVVFYVCEVIFDEYICKNYIEEDGVRN